MILNRGKKKRNSDEIVLGQILSGERKGRLFGLAPNDQEHHVMLTARTGAGKSRLLESMFLQHLRLGHGVCILDPHHDLSIDTLSYLLDSGFFRHEAAFDRLVYIDWGSGSFVPFNVLRGGADPKIIAMNALEAMMRVWPELRRAPAFQILFISAAMVLIENHLPITYMYQLLTDTPFRERCLQRVTDPLVLQSFSTYEHTKTSVKDSGSALRRAFLLTFSDVARLTLGQTECWIDHRKMMDAGQAVIHNLGNIQDAETRRLMGALLLVQIEQAALSRTDLPTVRRKPFTVLVDEWPSFTASDSGVATMLAQSRKFGLRLVLAAQSTADVSGERLRGAVENCRLNIVMAVGRESAVEQSRQLVTLDAEATKYDETTGRTRRVPSSEQFEDLVQDLQTLSPQEAYVKLHTKPAVKVQTLSIPNARTESAELAAVLQQYQRRYQRTRAEVEAVAPVLEPPPPSPRARPQRLELFVTPDDLDASVTNGGISLEGEDEEDLFRSI